MILSIDLMGISLKINYNIRIFKILMNVNKKIKIWNKLCLIKWDRNYLIEIFN